MIGMIIVGMLTAVSGFAAGWILRQFIGKKKHLYSADAARKYLEEARAESEDYKREKILEAKEEIFQAKQEFETAAKEQQVELKNLERKLSNRELNLDRKVDILNKKELNFKQLEHNLRIKEELLSKNELQLENLIQEENTRLERISGLTSEEAKQIQMRNMVEKAKEGAAQDIQEIREEANRHAIDESREIVIQALQRCAIDHVVESTVSIIQLPDDEMKGRIIGREGRNIRAFESATGIEVLIDDTPHTVVLSGFDPIRREVARQSLEKLLYDGRIHPGRIEEVVEKSKEEINEKIIEAGEQTLQDLGIHGMHHELVRLLGKQQFRMSYGQNLLQHSREVATLAGEMAAQLGIESTLARRAGVLHDVGKTAEEYGDSPYYELGAELAKKFGEHEKVQNAIACLATGFDDNRIISPISVLVKLADKVSVSRPGASKQQLDDYLKRMNNLEEIAASFSGVINSYAIQAGRELRVIVEHSIVDDNRAQILADNIVHKLRDEMEFPGQIKVTVFREYRSVDYAK